MRYYIADLHFFHEGLNTKMDMRGFPSVTEMNDHMIATWNEHVRKQDEVVVIGDLSFGKGEQTNEILQRLNGTINLIVGNHDKRYLDDKAFKPERFGWIKEYAELNDNNRKVILSHYPMPFYNGQFLKDEQGAPRTYMLYGHVHDTQDQRLMEQFQELTRKTLVRDLPMPSQMINCFCCYSGYAPLTLDDWIALDAKRLSAAGASPLPLSALQTEWTSPPAAH